jgi:hypothetical protein
MNKQIQQYKNNFMIFMILFTYTVMHMKLTGSYEFASLEKLTLFSAPPPFSYRVLLPSIGAVLNKLDVLKIEIIYFLLEFVFVSLLYLSLKKLLEEYFEENKACFLSLLFIILCSLIFILNYRYTIGREATFRFPYDTPALMFTILGIYLILKQAWGIYFICVFLATLNRESSILIILLVPIIYSQNKKQWLYPFITSLIIYLLTRGMLYYFISNSTATIFNWHYGKSDYMLFDVNFHWLFHEQNVLLFVAEFAFMPLFWFTFYDYIPRDFRGIRYLVFAYLLGLLCVGSVMESRIFGECVALMYLPVCLAVNNWMNGEQPQKSQRLSVLECVNRYFIIFGLIIITLIHKHLSVAVKVMSTYL